MLTRRRTVMPSASRSTPSHPSFFLFSIFHFPLSPALPPFHPSPFSPPISLQIPSTTPQNPPFCPRFMPYVSCFMFRVFLPSRLPPRHSVYIANHIHTQWQSTIGTLPLPNFTN